MTVNVMVGQSDKHLARVIVCPNCHSSKILAAWTDYGRKYLMKGYCCNCKQNWSEVDNGGNIEQ
jgi:hypothetical protein